MQQWLKEVARGKRGAKDLPYEEALAAARMITEGKATAAQTAAYFVAQRMKTESSDELLAFVKALQEHTKQAKSGDSIGERIIDFAGPYTGRHSFAATIPASILLSEYGIPVFLHSSDALPPKYGVSLKEIITQLGINLTSSPQLISKELETVNISFAATEEFCKPLKNLLSIREEIGVRTILNTVEKLLNIAGSKSLMLGAFHRTAINKMIPLFEGLGYEKVVVVQGIEGSEDVPIYRNSFIYEWSEGSLSSFIVKPEEYGLYEDERKETLTVAEQSAIITAILSGENSGYLGYYYKQVLFNTGIRYYYFGIVASIQEGIEIAKDQLARKAGLNQLEVWKSSMMLL